MTRPPRAIPLEASAALPPITPLGAALAEALPRLYGLAPGGEPRLMELIAALTAALERGELELDLAGPAPEGVQPAHWPGGYRAVLHRSPLCDAEAGPLVVDGKRLRWRRWHLLLEQGLQALVERARQPLAVEVAPELVRQACRQAAERGLDASQQQAVAAVFRHRLMVLSGGPGTGKTSTVVELLAARLQHQPQLRLHLAAPTGKAAARLREALAGGPLASLPCTTLHRLLESSGERFRRDRDRPLELDLLVVDEVSMVDLPLLMALLEALPPAAQLILVGDPAQLPPVGPGAVLLELMRPERLAQLGEAAVLLRTTYRNAGAIADLAARLRPDTGTSATGPLADGSADSAGDTLLAALEPQLAALAPEANLAWLPSSPRRLPQPLLERLRQHQQRLALLAASPGAALLAELEQLAVLSPTRLGPWGVEAIHRQLLGPLWQAPAAAWPAGTPVLNRRNLPELELANGDVGVLVGGDGERRVLFAGSDSGGPRSYHPARLGALEPALALTVHKAQGSQAAEVWLLLPPGRSWDVRLLYTGLTRARRQACLITPTPTPGPSTPVPSTPVPSTPGRSTAGGSPPD